jgi:hypothetical protein
MNVDLDVATKRMSQLMGRLIRSEEDFGVGVIIDGRFFKFYRWIKETNKDMIPPDMEFKEMSTRKACQFLENFWKEMRRENYEEYVDFKVEDVTIDDFIG